MDFMTASQNHDSSILNPLLFTGILLTSLDSEDDCYNHQQGVYSMIGCHTEDPSDARRSAYMLCYEMFWASYTYPRKGTRRDQHDLRSLTAWFPM